MLSASNRLRKSNGKQVTYQELNNCLGNKRPDMRSHLALLKVNDLSLINQSKTLQYKKLTNKSKNSSIKSVRKRPLLPQDSNNENKFSKTSKQFKTNTRQKNSHFQASLPKFRMTLRKQKPLLQSLEMKCTRWIPKLS